ncbi:MAG: hypothetical protein H0V44_00470 [Planctomycetes bacterium]|nr:hypothetical protein [Planctomycetota bacterium]
MRYLVMSALALAFASAPAFAEAADKASDKGKEMSAKATNTTCCCGKPVDAKVAPVEAKTADGKAVSIACCSDACAAEVKKDPAKALSKLEAAGKGEAKKDEKVK